MSFNAGHCSPSSPIQVDLASNAKLTALPLNHPVLTSVHTATYSGDSGTRQHNSHSPRCSLRYCTKSTMSVSTLVRQITKIIVLSQCETLGSHQRHSHGCSRRVSHFPLINVLLSLNRFCCCLLRSGWPGSRTRCGFSLSAAAHGRSLVPPPDQHCPMFVPHNVDQTLVARVSARANGGNDHAHADCCNRMHKGNTVDLEPSMMGIGTAEC